MTDLSQFSDAELEAIAGQGARGGADFTSFATQEAQRIGVRPDLVLKVMNRESAGDPQAISPKGARGLMQLMPGTARDLGVDPDDPYQNITGGVTYLKQQLDRYGGDERLALAAYNAGPGAVDRHGGVPPFAETQNYVEALAGGQGDDLVDMSDEDLVRIAGETPAAGDGSVIDKETGEALTDAQTRAYRELGVDRNATPGSRAFPLAQRRPDDLPDAGQWYVTTDGQLKQVPPSVAQDAMSGFVEPFTQLRDAALDVYERRTAQAKAPPPSLPQAARESVDDLADVPRLAGAVLNLASAPIRAAARPAARFLAENIPLKPHVQDSPFSKPRAVSGDEARAVLEGDLLTALQGGRAPGVNIPMRAAGPAAVTRVPGKSLTQQVHAVAPQMPVAAPRGSALAGLQAEKNAAYRAVDNSGVHYAQGDFKRLVDDITAKAQAESLDPEFHKAAGRMVEKLQERVAAGQAPTLTELDTIRKQISRDVIGKKADTPDAVFGMQMRDQIDAFIDSATPVGGGAGAADLVKKARALNTRVKKLETVERAKESAELQAATSGNGGNVGNTIRQKLRPLIDPTSNSRIRNLTPAERQALRKVVKGTTGQNALRALSAFDPTTGKLTALLQGGAAIGTQGLSAATIPVGMAARWGEQAIARRNLQNLMELIASGGIPLRKGASTADLVGAGVVAAPMIRGQERPSEPGTRRR